MKKLFSTELMRTRPRARSFLRGWAGKIFYALKRWLHWLRLRKWYVRTRDSRSLPYLIATHRTPLRRPLAKAEEWLEQNKIQNLRLAIPGLNGIVIPPGKALSYWKCLGNPTARKGYVPGMVLHQGTIGVGIGGGLCQLSNLLYWVTLYTPLTVKERWRHGYDVFPDVNRTQPFGSGATCYYPYLDLVIANETSQSFQLNVSLDEHWLTAVWRSDQPVPQTYRIEERDHLIMQAPWGAYIRSNRLFRIITSTNGEMREEPVAKNQAIMMYAPLLKADATK